LCASVSDQTKHLGTERLLNKTALLEKIKRDSQSLLTELVTKQI